MGPPASHSQPFSTTYAKKKVTKKFTESSSAIRTRPGPGVVVDDAIFDTTINQHIVRISFDGESSRELTGGGICVVDNEPLVLRWLGIVRDRRTSRVIKRTNVIELDGSISMSTPNPHFLFVAEGHSINTREVWLGPFAVDGVA